MTRPDERSPLDQIRISELITPQPMSALAGLLDIDVPEANTVPPLWHWVYLLDHRPHRDLGHDGHPSFGIPAPPAAGQRRMFAGGRVISHRPLRVGEEAVRTVSLSATTEKQGSTGPLTFVTVRHEIVQGGRTAVTEEHDIVYRRPGPQLPPGEPVLGGIQGAPVLELEVDSPMLFRFSALTYNAHRIHYDHAWARHEGYADLVIHGPLQVLMMAELMRRHGVSLLGHQFSFRLVAPLIGPQRMTVTAIDDTLSRAQVLSADGSRTALSELTEPAP